MLSSGIWAEKMPRAFQNLLDGAKEVALRSKSIGTVKKYRAYFGKFEDWCKDHGFLPVIPAKEVTLLLYLSHLVKAEVSLCVLYANLYGIKFAHTINGLKDPSDSPTIHHFVEGAKRKLSKPTTHRTPVTPGIMRGLSELCSEKIRSLRSLRFIAMALLAYSGFLRISEVLDLTRGCLTLNENHMVVEIRKSKTDPYSKGREVCIAYTNGPACPGRALRSYLSGAGEGGPRHYLFRSIVMGSKGSFALTSKNSPLPYSRAREDLLYFLEIVAPDAKNFGWHSLRHGGASAA